MKPLGWGVPLGVGAALWAYGPGLDGAAAVAFGLLLLALSAHDARTGEIPLRYTLGGTLAAVLWAAVRMGLAAAGMRALAALGVAAGVWALSRGIGALAGREVMGEGDALLLAFLTVVLGVGRIGTLLASAATLALAVFAARLLPTPWRAPGVWVAAALAAGMFAMGGWARLGALALPLAVVWPKRHGAAMAAPLPFGPMLAAGAVIALAVPASSWPPLPVVLLAPLFPDHPR